MLINKNAQQTVGDIVTFKLVNGDELVGKITDDTTGSVTLSKPVNIVLTQQGPSFAPVTWSGDPESEVKIDRINILFSVPTDAQLTSQYIKLTMGIQLVDGM